jgi:CheY-like chemotaxis protein
MGAKRALIVDDSRSARLILERILEKHAIGVDSAETAEAAIEYLATNRPDVIFMDHMMPGMDGLQAVAAIKNNPRTATIPIMMYTSQSGDVYLGQARALGAVGVLPKQIGPADVTKVLQQLRLADGPPQGLQVLEGSVPAPSVDEAARAPGGAPWREEMTELRRTLDTQSERIGAELRAVLLETRRAPGAAVPVPWHWVIAGGALLLAVVLGTLWVADMRRAKDLSAQLNDLEARVVRLAAAPAPAGPPPPLQDAAPPAKPAAVVPAADLRPLNLPVPFGADVMAGGRLESIRQFLYRLAHDGVSGVVDVKTYAGRYCLMGNALDGFSLAPDDIPYSKCDVVGNPSDDAPDQRTPLALANLVGEVRHATRGALDVQVSSGDATVTLVPYPVVAGDLTAGEWNRAGNSNNRVEVRLR